MKRNPNLQPLSDDHHRALVLARRLKRAAERGQDRATLSSAWAEVGKRFALELEPHFCVEEEWLFPRLESLGEAARVQTARGDHSRLRALVRSTLSPDVATEFAELLSRHVRSEERDLFPCAERLLGSDALEAVGRAALAARSAQPLVELIRQACIDAALAGYEDAAMSGLCHEGAWEAAIGAIRRLDLVALVAHATKRRAD